MYRRLALCRATAYTAERLPSAFAIIVTANVEFKNMRDNGSVIWSNPAFRVADEYQVRFLDDETAVMTHRASAPDPHWSMHVWAKRDGAWQVVATMSTPIEE